MTESSACQQAEKQAYRENYLPLMLPLESNTALSSNKGCFVRYEVSGAPCS
jgi:folate-binding Fe-S cluster repair protein YgfZ